MPYFKISGMGKESNRKRTKRYKAKDETAAKLMAETEGTIVEAIEYEKPEPATDRQINYAKDLGLSFPPDININEMSNLISKKVDDDRDAPNWLLEYVLNIFPEENDLSITKYIGIENLFGRLINKYSEEKNYKSLVTILLYSIINESKNYNWTKPFNEIADILVIENLAQELSANQQVINSIKRYNTRDYVSLGELINDEGYESFSNAKRTNAYLISKKVLKENALISSVEKQYSDDKNSIRPKISKKAVSQNKGCLVTLILFISTVILFLLNVP